MKKVIIAAVVCILAVGVYFGVKNKSVPKENGLIESSSTNTSNIDTSNLVKEELYSEGQGKKIYGYITAPKNYKDQKLPTVIISHGFGGLAERGDFYAQSLAKAGFVVYSFDFMGGNKNSRSGNDTLNMSVFTEVDDLDVVISKLKSQSYVDQSKLFLLGQSQGGVVSTIEAAKLKRDIKGLILVFPAFVLFDDARELFKSTSDIPEVYNHRGSEVGRAYFEKSLDYDVYQDIKNYDGKVLIVHGTNDTTAPISYSRKAVETFPNAVLKEIQGAGHGFRGAQQEEATKYIVDFVKENT